MKKQLKKLLIINICIMFSITSICFFIFSTNIIHKHNCNEINCNICNLMYAAENFVKEILIIYIINFIFEICIIYFLSKLYIQKRIYKNTLIDYKVVQIK